jgi:hypothetical protein
MLHPNFNQGWKGKTRQSHLAKSTPARYAQQNLPDKICLTKYAWQNMPGKSHHAPPLQKFCARNIIHALNIRQISCRILII